MQSNVEIKAAIYDAMVSIEINQRKIRELQAALAKAKEKGEQCTPAKS